MHIKEPPNIKDFDRKYTFTHIEWITSDAFESVVNNAEIHPYLVGIDDKKIYVGKAILEREHPKVEVIGVVSKNLNGKWQIGIPYASGVKVIEDKFLVLNIPDPNAFTWVESKPENLPKYALRGTVEVHLSSFLYIGRVIANENKKPIGEYYSGGWKKFNETVTSSFGKIHVGHKLLYVPINNREVAFNNNVEILCLNPTPAPLKVLGRSRIREMLRHDETRINRLKNFLPLKLFNFLQYPNVLSSGEYMLPNEKLISECGKFEIKITDDKCFVFKNRETGKEYFTKDINSFFLHFNQIVGCRCDETKLLKYNIINDRLNPQEYKLKIVPEVEHNQDSKTHQTHLSIEQEDSDDEQNDDLDQDSALYEIQMLNEDQDVTNTLKFKIRKHWDEYNWFLDNEWR